jgi:hypothetical protein
MVVSGIITTNLGKTATFNKVAGRERRVHHSKSLPLPLIGERLFFIQNSAIPGSSYRGKSKGNGFVKRFFVGSIAKSPF